MLQIGVSGAVDNHGPPSPGWATLPRRGTGNGGSRSLAAGTGGPADHAERRHGAWGGAAGGGQRLGWADAPAWLRDEVERRLGAGVVEAVTQPGGLSPGVAARLRLADGRRAFVKAVGPEPNPDSPGIHRSEARNMAALPRSAPAARMLWSLGRRGWVALAFEDVDGVHPSPPWRPGELRRVLEMVAATAAALTPAPPTTTSIADRLRDSTAGWRRLAAAHPVAAGADPRLVTTALAACAGYLAEGSRLPPPPGLPTLRAFQHGQAVVALEWLRLRTGWP
jgi:Phosphotransferase enzyme family